MITSIVKMRVKPACSVDFQKLAQAMSDEIRTTDGCSHFDLFNDKKNKSIFFAYSIWASEKHLEKYRKSVFNQTLWPKVKEFLAARPVAWTVENILKR